MKYNDKHIPHGTVIGIINNKDIKYQKSILKRFMYDKKPIYIHNTWVNKYHYIHIKLFNILLEIKI